MMKLSVLAWLPREELLSGEIVRTIKKTKPFHLFYMGFSICTLAS